MTLGGVRHGMSRPSPATHRLLGFHPSTLCLNRGFELFGDLLQESRLAEPLGVRACQPRIPVTLLEGAKSSDQGIWSLVPEEEARLAGHNRFQRSALTERDHRSACR